MVTPGDKREARLKEARESAQKMLLSDYFTTLEIARTASAEDVKKAFLEQARVWHPDRVPQGLEELRPLFQKVFGRLELARATVSDPTRRARYLEELIGSADASAAEGAIELRKAEVLLKKNDAVGAEKHLRRAVLLAPGNIDARVLLAWLEVKPDTTPARLQELVEELSRLIGRSCTSNRAYFYRGQLRKRLDLVQDAHVDFLKAASLDPKDLDAAREVRLYTMRQQRTPAVAMRAKPSPAAPDGAGVGGFLRKLFKR